MLLWDPSAKEQIVLPVAELPVHIADLDGKFVLQILDRILSECSDVVHSIVFDAAGGHQVVRRLLMGVGTAEDMALLQDPALKFFPRIQYVDLPEHGLPRLPVRLALFEGEVLAPLCGPCALMNIY